jgi:hypothetical protein
MNAMMIRDQKLLQMVQPLSAESGLSPRGIFLGLLVVTSGVHEAPGAP